MTLDELRLLETFIKATPVHSGFQYENYEKVMFIIEREIKMKTRDYRKEKDEH